MNIIYTRSGNNLVCITLFTNGYAFIDVPSGAKSAYRGFNQINQFIVRCVRQSPAVLT